MERKRHKGMLTEIHVFKNEKGQGDKKKTAEYYRPSKLLSNANHRNFFAPFRNGLKSPQRHELEKVAIVYRRFLHLRCGERVCSILLLSKPGDFLPRFINTFHHTYRFPLGMKAE